MDKAELFNAVPCTLFPLGRAQSLALTSVGRLLDVKPLAGRVLATCHGWRTIEDHALTAWRSGVTSDPHALAEAVDDLVSLGLLVPLRSVAAPPRSGGHISTVAIVTADRPAMLKRALASALRHVRHSGRRPRFLVIDGSGAQATDTMAVTRACGASHQCEVQYAGRQRSDAVRQSLVSTGVPTQVLHFGLSPGPIGSNRNLAILETAGEDVLMVDDDILWDPWAVGVPRKEITFRGHGDVREWRFFKERAEAVDAVTRAEVDLLALHGDLLGVSLGTFLCSSDTETDLQHACGHITSSVSAGRDPIVRVTMTGLAGDSARYCPYRLLFQPGVLRDLLSADRVALETALSSREVHNIAKTTTVMHEPLCMSYCMAVDNRSLVPPFIPIGRGEDSVFGATLSAIDPLALFAHLPYGVIHDSSRPSRFGPDFIPSARETRLADYLIAMIASATHLGPRSTVAARLTGLGQHILDIGELPHDEFISAVTRTQVQLRCSQIADLEAFLVSTESSNELLRSALAEYQRTFRSSASDPVFFVPVEFRGPWSIDEGFLGMQGFLRELGQFFRVWPDIWAAAASMNADRPD